MSNEQNKRQNDAVGDESAAHDEMRRALAQVIALAETQRGDAAKDHLDPGKQRHGLANDGVAGADELADSTVEPALPVPLEIETKDNLANQEELENIGKDFVNVSADELASAVRVAEEEAEEGET